MLKVEVKVKKKNGNKGGDLQGFLDRSTSTFALAFSSTCL